MPLYGVFRNEDLTEGRGRQLPVAICDSRAVADVIAVGIDVQGTNGTVKELKVFRTFEEWFDQASGWERSTHLTRLRKQRDALDAQIRTAEEKR